MIWVPVPFFTRARSRPVEPWTARVPLNVALPLLLPTLRILPFVAPEVTCPLPDSPSTLALNPFVVKVAAAAMTSALELLIAVEEPSVIEFDPPPEAMVVVPV
jgi:hypothetical protein